MSKKIDDEEYFDVDDNDESFDYLDKIYHKRHTAKRRNDARRKLEKLQESQALDRLLKSDDLYDWD
jgi:hypothetical protein